MSVFIAMKPIASYASVVYSNDYKIEKCTVFIHKSYNPFKLKDMKHPINQLRHIATRIKLPIITTHKKETKHKFHQVAAKYCKPSILKYLNTIDSHRPLLRKVSIPLADAFPKRRSIAPIAIFKKELHKISTKKEKANNTLQISADIQLSSYESRQSPQSIKCESRNICKDMIYYSQRLL